ncbi:hypothetical protein HT576_08780 [Haloterrigena sp. SYSU A121-1]|uniref:LamG-like jellyroll fold domain-containing protein n=2 Tax=Haloterrigena gelatinilytica TaxID=2741724 RepID=A0A8J8GJG6_9EURY|nr:hypothetical protein [Haloterrigena gelatinilytica]
MANDYVAGNDGSTAGIADANSFVDEAGFIGKGFNSTPDGGDNSQYITVSQNDVSVPTNTEPRTAMAWIKVNQQSNDKFFSYGSDSGTATNFDWTVEGDCVKWRYSNGNTDFACNEVATGEWFHWAVVVPSDASTVDDATVYINGTAYTTSDSTSISTDASDLYIGVRHKGSSTGGFRGYIDDFQFYDQELTQDQIQAHYEGGTLETSDTGDGGDGASEPIQLTLHNPQDGDVFDSSDVWLNVTANETVDTWTRQLDGSNTTFTPNTTMSGLVDSDHDVKVWVNTSDHITSESASFTVDTSTPLPTIHSPENTTYTTGSVDIDVTADESISTWKYNLDSGGNTTFIPNTSITGLSDGNHDIIVYAEDEAGNTNSSQEWFTINVSAGGDVTPINDSMAEAHSLNNADTLEKVFLSINGTNPVNEGLDSQDHWIYGTFWNNETQIEHKNADTGGWNDSRVYNQSSENELCAVQTQPVTFERCPNGDSNLQLFMPFDQEDAGTDAFFTSISPTESGFDGDEKGATGQVGNAYDFDGSDDYIDMGDNFIDGWSAATVSAWIKVNTKPGTTHPVIHKRGSDDDNFRISVRDDFDLRCYYDAGGDTHVTIDGGIGAGAWYHVTCSYDGNKVRLYVDGTLNNTGSESGSLKDNTNNFQIAGDTDRDRYVDVEVDDLRVYNQNVSASQVQSLYSLNADIGAVGQQGTQPLNVTLNDPADGASFTGKQSIQFNVTARDDTQLENVSLWTNETGTWGPRNSTTVSGTEATVTFDRTLDVGHYEWSALTYNNESQGNWSKTNRTLTVNYEAPSLSLDSPADGSTEANPAWHNFTPTCNSDSCDTAELFINDSGVSSNFTWKSQNQVASVGADGSIDLADFDDDGKIDVAYADGGSDYVEWCEQGSSTTDWTCHSVASGYNEIEGLEAVDFDGDGTYELAIMDQGNNDLDIASQDTSDPTGSWSTVTVDSSANNVQSGLSADIDDDGDNDLFYAYEGGSSGDGGVYWQEYTGGDVLTASNYNKHEIVQREGAWWISHKRQDFSDDGNATDLLVTFREGKNSAADGGLYWYEQNDTDVTSTWPENAIDTSHPFLHADSGNFCGNGTERDVVGTGTHDGSHTGIDIYCYDDNWQSHTVRDDMNWHGVKAVDIDKQGRWEIIGADNDGSTNSIRIHAYQDGSWSETDSETYSKADDNMIPYDLTGDGYEELFTISENSNSVDWWAFHRNTNASDWVAYNSTSSVTDGTENSLLFDYSQNFTLDTTRHWNIKLTQSDGQTAFADSNNTITVQEDTTDTTPPSITIYHPPNATISDSSPWLNVTADEAVDVWQYSVDDGSNTTFAPNTTLSGLSEGAHTVTVYANDTDGNMGSQSKTFTVDTTDPTVSYNPSSTGSGTIDHDWILVNVSASDNLELSTVTEQFDGSNSSFTDSDSGNYWTNHTGLADGTYTVKGFAADNAGNTDSTNEREITVDTSSSDSDSDSDPAYFDVNITGTNSPVTEGEILNVTADVVNTGDESDTQNVTLEIDGEQVDSSSGTLSGGQSTSITFTYVTEDGDAGDRTATVASNDDTDSTTVTVEAADDGSTGDTGDETNTGSDSSPPSSDDDNLQNITVSSALEKVRVGTSVTGSVMAENPNDINVTLQIASAMDASCDYIALVDEDEWGAVEYELTANASRSIGYEIDLTGIDTDTLHPGDSITCEYDVSIPEGEDTEFAVTAEITAPGLLSRLAITGPTGNVSSVRGPLVAGIVIVLTTMIGIFWFRR